jgi:hypothetical protein
LEAEFEGLIVGAQRGEARQGRRDEDGEWKYVTHAGNLLQVDVVNHFCVVSAIYRFRRTLEFELGIQLERDVGGGVG